MSKIENMLSSKFFNFSDYQVDFHELQKTVTSYGIRIVGVVVLVIVAWTVASYSRRAVRKTLDRARVDITLGKFFSNALRWLILIIAGMSVLSIFGIEIASFAAILAAGSLAIGLAFQGTLSNFAAGIMLLIFRPFKVGDTIKVSAITGKVDEIDFFSTHVDTPDMRRIIIPNSAIFGSTIENISHHAIRRIDLVVLVENAIPIREISESLKSVLNSLENVVTPPNAKVAISNIAPTQTEWTLNIWVRATEFDPVKEIALAGIHERLTDLRALHKVSDLEKWKVFKAAVL